MAGEAKQWAWAAVLATATILAACDGREQARPLNYDKGTYLGNPDEKLSQQTLDQLRERATYQAYGSEGGFGASGAGIGSSGSSVRPPTYQDAQRGPAQAAHQESQR